MKALYVDVEAAAARMPKVDPEDRDAVAQATLDRAASLAATGKFVWPIWDKGLKKRIHRINAPTLLIWVLGTRSRRARISALSAALTGAVSASGQRWRKKGVGKASTTGSPMSRYRMQSYLSLAEPGRPGW